MDTEEDDGLGLYGTRNSVVSPTVPTRDRPSSEDTKPYDNSNSILKAFNSRTLPKKSSTPHLKVSTGNSSSKPGSFSAAVGFSSDEERDSVLSNSPAPRDETVSGNASALSPPTFQTKGEWPEQETHFLIFLKEVKKLSWRDLMIVYQKEFPTRNYGSVQTYYSHKVNKRDRSLDPPRLNLPPNFSADALVDWPSVHSRFPLPIQNSRLTQEAEQLRRQNRKPPQRHFSESREGSSANESGPPKARPRRAAPVNYTWPKRRFVSQEDEGLIMDDLDVVDAQGIFSPARTGQSSDELHLGPDTVIPVDKPMMMDFEQEDAGVAVALGQNLPYLSFSQRSVVKSCPKEGEWEQLTGRNWQGLVLHVDFNHKEEQVVERTIAKVLPGTQAESTSLRKRLHKVLRHQPDHKILQLAYEIRRKLSTRDQASIDAFLVDAKAGKLHSKPQIERIGAVRPNRKFSSAPKTSASSLIRQRELGLQSRRGWKSACRPLSYQMQNNVQDTLGPVFSFTGASSDIHTVAWSADGQCFAAGAVCVTDVHSMQYNRPNNLLYGDLTNGTIRELGEHWIDRPLTDTGPNSTYAMQASQPPYLYTTISSVAFSPSGEYMFSAGYDEVAAIWRTSRDGSQPEVVKQLKHKKPVDILTVGCHGKVATASKKPNNAVKVICMNENNPTEITKQSYASTKAQQHSNLNILPTALQFEPNYGRLLLAGFGANSKASESRLDTFGDICLWDVETQQQLSILGSGKNVFDVAFNPTQAHQPLFAVGCVAGQNVNRGTRSLLRLHDIVTDGRYSMVMEMECAALDMNDVVWCPYDENLIAAGCTSGRTYVWDIRNPNDYLYSLSHGKSLMPLDEYADREVTDTGVRFLSWGHNATRLYSGSSDGVVKVWDVVGSPQDVFIKDLITIDSGVMSGAFSPDKSKLIVGEVNGSISILEVGRDDCSIKETERLRYLPYQTSDADHMEVDASKETMEVDSGRAIASELLVAEEMISIPMSGLPIRQSVQGPNYRGPFDNGVDAPFLREQALEMQLRMTATSGTECSIPSCMDDISKITFEETGDSGRSADRIPDELRKQWKLTGSSQSTFPGKAKCVDCGRPARPVESTSNIVDSARCERCSFTCFRCGAMNKIRPETDRFECAECLRIWSIGALGYECLQGKDMRVGDPLKGIRETSPELEKRRRQRAKFLDDDTTFGDDMNALTDYYLSLAISRPDSPPL
ncbi:WD40 repeat-like protein [Pleomassaria siparia CBS 279.74]|uniref:WD40 repeat-like protein n=1 Tax=Pleomassaria siparia CBS 279.74 TaxID=1314801 RepID=A0A6G1KF04_9PLEO|nr:WD40 repeat-like protein [Pleomassaria siparia CBS 279.74]